MKQLICHSCHQPINGLTHTLKAYTASLDIELECHRDPALGPDMVLPGVLSSELQMVQVLAQAKAEAAQVGDLRDQLARERVKLEAANARVTDADEALISARADQAKAVLAAIAQVRQEMQQAIDDAKADAQAARQETNAAVAAAHTTWTANLQNLLAQSQAKAATGPTKPPPSRAVPPPPPAPAAPITAPPVAGTGSPAPTAPPPTPVTANPPAAPQPAAPKASTASHGRKCAWCPQPATRTLKPFYKYDDPSAHGGKTCLELDLCDKFDENDHYTAQQTGLMSELSNPPMSAGELARHLDPI